jgi:nitrate reductase gamma subunit
MDSLAKSLLVLTAAALLVFGLSGPVEATWLIDPKKFHASVHGQFSCQDCHEAVGRRDGHPDPADIVKKRTDFFAVDDCLVCHSDVLDKLEAGTHGTLKVKSPESYGKCFRCHEPHTQTPVHEEAGRFDPSRPRHEQCGVCHEEQKTLPPLSKEDETCMDCHRTVGPGDEERLRGVCFFCHARTGTRTQKMTAKKVSPIVPGDYDGTVHANLACTQCHPQAVRFSHGQQEPADCERCHERHHEKVAHDLHGLVTCGACHLGGVRPARDGRSKRIVWERVLMPEEPSGIHDMVVRHDERTCEACHSKGNRIGAAAMVLPPKSILCMPCHAATFSVGDTTTILTLVVFLAGMSMMFGYVLTGSGRKKTGAVGTRPNSGGQARRVAKALVLDVLFQRRLYHQSKTRWFIHGLIFYSFVFRFLWGLAGLLGSLWKPEWSWVWIALDKNSPVTAFLFDLTGIMIMIGIALALFRGARKGATEPSDLPQQDQLALILIGVTVAVGFVLEGMRIAMTGYPPGSSWAVIGHGIGLFFSGLDTTGFYGYGWYAHAVLTGMFVAYIPFSKLAHVIIAPVVLALNAAGKH